MQRSEQANQEQQSPIIYADRMLDIYTYKTEQGKIEIRFDEIDYRNVRWR